MNDHLLNYMPPDGREIYIMVDYVEFLCLINKEISLDSVIGYIYKNPENESEIYTGNKEHPDANLYEGEMKDRERNNATQWFEHTKIRKNYFGQVYPFDFKDELLSLNESLDESNILYIFLLLCANLRNLNKKKRYNYTDNFELLSLDALKIYLPGFNVEHFGKSSVSKDFPSKLSDAILDLAIKICEQPLEKNILEIKPNDTGDFGLDIVAWRRPAEKDRAPGGLICFVQCTCSSSKWVEKQHDSHPDKWRSCFDFVHFPANIMFIPFCYRNSDDKWVERRHVRSILMDRFRICLLFNNSNLQNAAFFPYIDKIVNDFISNNA
ncbi:hypothetical protein [Candidatus Magnetominusculus dajiuhuensis]|uniref:hypothetical protein n=1 Tax=Candidatus Magnetominusculus dajiuhuensis TaxID=3137712 RepID=UPI003B42FDB6